MFNRSSRSTPSIRHIVNVVMAAVMMLTVIVIVPSADAGARAAQPAVSLEQCGNGPATAPAPGGCDWVNGNLGPSKSHLIEGYSVPYRAILSDLPILDKDAGDSPITILFGFDVRSGSHTAIDFVTSYDRLEPHTGFGHAAETPDPTDGITFGPSNGASTSASIPAPSNATAAAAFNALSAAERTFTYFGGTIDNVRYTVQGDYSAPSSEAVIAVDIWPADATGVLAWGGNIARTAVWGEGNAAGDLSGSPYHMRLKGWTLNNLGQQDRSLKADAVFPTGTIVITKRAVGGEGSFTFGAVDPTGSMPSSFIIDTSTSDTVTFDGLLAGEQFSPRLVSEDTASLAAGWTFDSVACVEDGDQNSTTDGPTASIELDANEVVTCTFINSRSPSLRLVKVVANDDGGTAVADDWTLTAQAAAPDDGRNISTPGGSGVFETVFANTTYTLSETGGPDGYAAGSWSCDGGTLLNGAVTLAAGERVTCEITNRDIAPTLKLVKNATNDDGGTAVADDWTLTAQAAAPDDGRNISTPGGSGVFETVFANTTYTLSETGGPDGYAAGSWSCDGGTLQGDTVILAIGETGVTCTITNDDVALPVLTIEKLVDDLDGGWVDSATYPSSQTTATWQVTVSNVTDEPVYSLELDDEVTPSCESALESALVAAGWSDEDGGFLPGGESVVAQCAGPIAAGAPIVNTAIATGVDAFGRGVEPVQDQATVLRVAASATIGDTVWSDANANGVQDDGELGIAGAVVQLTLPDGTSMTATTNANGLYLFSALEAGTYSVQLDLGSIAAPSEGSISLTTPGSFTVTLVEGQSFLTADFGVTSTLPVTGLSSDRIAALGLALLMLGAIALAATRRRRGEGPATGT